MAGEFSTEEASKLIFLARKSIEYHLASGTLLKEETKNAKFKEKRGVFITLNSFPDKQLRGCIGFPEPVFPLWNAVIEASVSAGFKDPRFPPLKANELEEIVIEISILSVPELIDCKPEELSKNMDIGEDGLIVRSSRTSGLLLPQVATEYGWSEEEFLEHTCMKAGLEQNCWKNSKNKFYKFQAQVFGEKEPAGLIEEE